MASHALGEVALGQALSHYRIVDKIGAGGMGEVYRARDEHLDREVAIKVIAAGTLSDESARKRFHKEALALSKLSHPNIATIHDFDTQHGVDFLVMEYIPGITLSYKIAGGPLAEREITRLGVELAKGLAAAHDRGIVHCDLKPGNLRLMPDGRLKILDFGLAKLVHPVSPDLTTASLTETKTTAGTLPYMAPEQLRGEEVDRRTDVYGMGTVLYEMATGSTPFAHTQAPSLIDAILHDTPAPPRKLNHKISSGLDAVVMKSLEKNRDARYNSVHELQRDLEKLEAAEAGGPIPLRALAASQMWHRLARWKKATAAFSFMLACAVCIALWIHSIAPALAFSPRDYVLVSDFENQTGDPVFDRSLTAALSTTLEQSTLANVYPRARIKETLKRMAKTNVDHIDEPLALEIAQRDGIPAVVVPSISGVGERYRLAARIVETASGVSKKTEMARANSKQNVLDAVDELGAYVRRDLGESLRNISQNSKPLVSATTPSLEALKQYSMGIEKHRAAALDEAKIYYENALRIDPHFTAAQASLGLLHLDQAALGTPQFDAQLGKRLLTEAAQHVSNLPDKEKYKILSAYAQWVEHDFEKSAGYLKGLLVSHPDPAIYNNLAWVYHRMGRYEDSIAAAQEAIRIDPRMILAYMNLAGVQLYEQGDVKRALDTCQRALQVDPQNSWAYDCVGWASFGKGDWAGAQAAFEKAISFNSRNILSRYRLAHAHRLQGHYSQALEVLAPIQKFAPSENAVWYDMGVVHALMGEHKQSRDCFQHFVKLMEAEWRRSPKDADSAFALAAVLFRLGDKQRAWTFTHKGAELGPGEHFAYATALSLGERKSEAIKELQLAIQSGDHNYIFMKIHPDLDSLHGDPRFEKLLTTVIKY